MLILASASPRRRELLAQMGEVFLVEASSVPEERRVEEPPVEYVRRLAEEKAEAVWRLRWPELGGGLDREGHPLLVVGADTCVVCGEELLGKPVDAADAVRMLRTLRGRTHQVHTGVAVVSRAGTVSAVETTEVVFGAVSDEEIAAYVATGEPMDKAGSYGIQGHAGRWIPRIEGCYFNVVGLPLARVAGMLRGARARLIAG